MPTVKIIGRFRFHFYSADRNEPPHIHVSTPDGEAKFWLQPISIAFVRKLSRKELSRAMQLVHTYQEEFLEAWHEYFQDEP